MDKIASSLTRRCFLKIAAACASSTLCSPLFSQATPIDLHELPASNLLLTDCSVIDVARGEVVRGMSLLVRDGRIAMLSGGARLSGADAVIDLQGRFVLPGLIDAHCHTTLGAMADFNPFAFKTAADQMPLNFQSQLNAGITTLRDMGGLARHRERLAGLLAAKKIAGPHLVQGLCLLKPGSRYEELDPADLTIFSKTGLACRTPGAADFSSRLAACGAPPCFIKLGFDAEPEPGCLDAVLRWARQAGLRAAGRARTCGGFSRAVQAGIASIEHLPGDGLVVDADLRRCAASGTAVVPALLGCQMRAEAEAYAVLPGSYSALASELEARAELLAASAAHLDPRIAAGNAQALALYGRLRGRTLFVGGEVLSPPGHYFDMLRYGRENLARLRQAGALIGCGTDAGTPFTHHGSLHAEMELYVRLGFSAAEALRCATINNARLLGLESELGSIETGKAADMVVLAENPLADIRACRSPVMVFKRGEAGAATRALVRRGTTIRLSA